MGTEETEEMGDGNTTEAIDRNYGREEAHMRFQEGNVHRDI